MKLRAIIPRQLPSNPEKGSDALNELLRDFAAEFQSQMQEYPPWQPWKSTPPRRGPRRGGRRTGTYGRGWAGAPRFGRFSVTMENKVRYATYVGGPKQTKNMAQRGWPQMRPTAERILRGMRLPDYRTS